MKIGCTRIYMYSRACCNKNIETRCVFCCIISFLNIKILNYGEYPSISNCRTQIPGTFRRIFENFFAEFRNFYLFVPRFLVIPLTTFCGMLVRRRCLHMLRTATERDIFGVTDSQILTTSLRESEINLSCCPGCVFEVLFSPSRETPV